MRKLVVVGAISTLAAVAALVPMLRSGSAQQPPAPDSLVAFRLSVADSGTLRGPRQPIFFRHDIHAGQYKIQCQYCHYSVAASSEPGIPSLQTCMGCHTTIGGSDSTHRVEIQKLRQFWRDSADVGKPRLEWVRIHSLARHVRFPHMRHLKAMGPNACQTCHGDVARMPQVYKVNNVNNMGFCVSCHLERKVNRDCTACHY